jgi:hypothetical protein
MFTRGEGTIGRLYLQYCIATTMKAGGVLGKAYNYQGISLHIQVAVDVGELLQDTSFARFWVQLPFCIMYRGKSDLHCAQPREILSETRPRQRCLLTDANEKTSPVESKRQQVPVVARNLLFF